MEATRTEEGEDAKAARLIRATETASIMIENGGRVAYDSLRSNHPGMKTWDNLDDRQQGIWNGVSRDVIRNASPHMASYFLGEVARQASDVADRLPANATLDRMIWKRIATWAMSRRRRVIDWIGEHHGPTHAAVIAAGGTGDDEVPPM